MNRLVFKSDDSYLILKYAHTMMHTCKLKKNQDKAYQEFVIHQ